MSIDISFKSFVLSIKKYFHDIYIYTYLVKFRIGERGRESINEENDIINIRRKKQTNESDMG